MSGLKNLKQNECSTARKDSSISNIADSKYDTAETDSACLQKSQHWHKSHPQPIWDFDKGINSLECAKIGTISYREKRNPLASTRLSCYKPKITEHYSLPHYKSVDDFLFLNSSDEVASNSSTSTVGSDYSGLNQTVIEKNSSNPHLLDSNENLIEVKDKKLNELHINEGIEREKFEDNKSDRSDSNERYGFRSLTTKSVENIFEPKLYALASTPTNNKRNRRDMANFSEKIKTMSSRTQKLFSRIYNNSENKSSLTNKQTQIANQISDAHVHEDEIIPNNAKTTTAENKTSKSRRSLSYGHLPGLEDFRATLKNFNKSQNSKNHIKEEAKCQRKPNNTAARDQNKDDVVVSGEDTDSGILVNESGQSSFIETDDVFHAETSNNVTDRCSSSINKAKNSSDDVNANFEFKFVQLCIAETDTNRALGFGVKAVRNETMNKRIGYQVASIRPGGIVDR